MPLNRDGEVLDDLQDIPFVVVPSSRLSENNRLMVPYEIVGKFRSASRPRLATRPLFNDVMAVAQQRFLEAGAMMPIGIDESSIQVQVYPSVQSIAVIVHRMIAGQEHFVVRIYPNIPNVIIESLVSDERAKHHA